MNDLHFCRALRVRSVERAANRETTAESHRFNKDKNRFHQTEKRTPMKLTSLRNHPAPPAVRLLLTMVAVIGLAVQSGTAAAPSGYVLNWSDEFDGTSIDTGKWRVPNGEDHFGAISDPSLVTVSGGLLRLRGGWINNAIRTGLIDTKGKKYMRYGYYEVRCRQNGATGIPDTGWPAVSMYNEGQWPPEYEVAEYAIAGWVPDWTKMNQSIILDFNNDGQIDYNNTPTSVATRTDFHVFAILLRPGVGPVLYRDGSQTTDAGSNRQDLDMFNLILNIYSGNGDSTRVPTFEVDYVRWYVPGTTSSSLASGKPVTVSSTESASYPGSNAVDGNAGTRWSSAFSDPQWIYVDLQATYNINRVKLNWEAAYGRAYQIQVSANASTWTTIYSTTTGDGGIDDLTGLSGSGRYVRMYGTQRGSPYGYSLWEIEVYGSSSGGPVADGTYKIIARHSGRGLDAAGTANAANVQQWSYYGGSNQKWTITHLGSSQYKIIGVQSGRCLDVAAQSTADGANVQLWDYLGQANQKWTLAATSGGYYSVRAVHSGKALDVSGISTADGANVHQWSYLGQDNQQWAFQAP
jgi:beta-glucanase (GH16 family)